MLNNGMTLQSLLRLQRKWRRTTYCWSAAI